MIKSEAIVAAEQSDTALAEPKTQQDELLLEKRRCYLSAARRPQTLRQNGLCDVSLTEKETVLVSNRAVQKINNDIKPSSLIMSAINFALGMTLIAVTHLMPLIFSTASLLYAAAWVNLLWGACTGVKAVLHRQKRNKFLKTLPTENDEICAGISRIEALAQQRVKNIDDILIESVFLALDHPDATVRRQAAELAAELPPGMQAQAIRHYRTALTVRAQRLLPGMADLSPNKAAAYGIGLDPKLPPACCTNNNECLEWDLRADDDGMPRNR